MRVRFTTSIASADWSYFQGQEAEVEDYQAGQFIKGGICVAVEEIAPESASLAPAEAAVLPRARKKAK